MFHVQWMEKKHLSSQKRLALMQWKAVAKAI